MRSIKTFMKMGWPMLLAGIVVVVLQGCTTPLVDVKVSTCAQEDPGETGKGGCNSYPSGTPQYTGPAYGFQMTATTFYTGNGNCSGGKKCAGYAGRCANGKPCTSWVIPETMACRCDCAP